MVEICCLLHHICNSIVDQCLSTHQSTICIAGGQGGIDDCRKCSRTHDHVPNACHLISACRGAVIKVRDIVVDRHSMLTKDVLEFLSGVLGNHRNNVNGVDATVPFGGLNVILLGDFHQFLPVGNMKVVLYHAHSKTE